MQGHAKISRLIVAAATASLLTGTASFAMGREFTELDKTIRADMAQLGIPAPNFDTLTYQQIGEISDILSSSDKGGEKQKAEIEYVLNSAHPGAQAMPSVRSIPGGAELERIVVGDLKGLGVTVDHPEKLTLKQLELLSDALNDGNDKGEAGVRQRVEEILRM